jgi:hypothetical protein
MYVKVYQNYVILTSLQEQGSEEDEFYATFAATGVSYESGVEEVPPKELQHGPVLNRALYQVD